MALIGDKNDVLQLLNKSETAVYMINVTKAPNPLSKVLPYSVDQAAVKLVQLGVPKDDARLLQKQDVDGASLPYLTDDNLTKMGIPTFGRRVKILRAVQSIILEAGGGESASRSTGGDVRSSSTRRPVVGGGDSDDEDDRRARERKIREREELERRERERTTRSRADDDDIDRRREGISASAASDDDDDDDVDEDDVEREYENPRLKAKAAAVRKSTSDDPDDMFATEDQGDGVQVGANKPWLGAIVPPTYPPKNNPTAPDKSLRLEWVHGYRAFDSRSNLVYNTQGDIIYPVAGVCVLYRPKTRTQKFFLGHNDDVRCLAQHPTNPNIIATGQNASVIKGKSSAPFICVWDSTDFTRNNVLKLTQADRAVRAVTFTGDGKYLISVSNDDNHTLRAWDWEKRTVVASAKGDANPIFLARGNPTNPREIVTVGKRHCMFWDFDGTRLKGSRGSYGSKTVSFYACAFSEKGYACLGGEDGSIYVFAAGKLAKVFPNIHKGKVLTIGYYPGGLVSGGSDGRVHILDKKMEVGKSFSFSDKIAAVHITNDNLLVGTNASEVYEIRDFPDTDVESEKQLEAVTRGHHDGELWALCVAPDGKHYVTAGEDNTVCLWETAGHRMLKKGIISEKKGKAPKIKKASTTSLHPTNQCARAIAISPNGKHIIVGTNNGEVTVLDTRTLGNPDSNYRLATIDLNKYGKRAVTDQTGNWIQVIKYSPSGQTCAVGTHGSVVVLLDVTDGYKPKGILKASSSAITHLDWSTDGTAIQTNDLGYELLFYRVDENDLKAAAHVPNVSSMKDVKWASQTCVLGWSIQGIFDQNVDGTDINSLDCSPSRSLVVSGDDSGNVCLFRYPVAKGNSKVTAPHAHSSHVVTTRFTADEKYVLSTGGHDLAIMQWAVVSNSSR